MFRHSVRLMSCAALCACAALSPARSLAESSDAGSRDLSAWDFSSENDVYGNWGDRYYTSGLRLAYVSPDTLGSDSPTTLRWFAGAAQEIYSPKDRYAVNPPPNDHPYSAWLYATGGVAWADDASLDLFTLNAGVVGPSALGEQTQNNYHRLIGVKRLEGWDTQLHDEPGLGIAWLRVWRFRAVRGESGWGVDVLPRAGVEAGTVRDRAHIGLQARFGQNLPDDFGELRMRDGIAAAAPVKYTRRESWRAYPDAWYIFLDLHGEAKAWDMSLDGNLWHDSRSVDSRPLVGRFSFGAAAHWGSARVALTQVVETESFKGQRDVPFTWGALTVTVVH